MMSDDAGWVKWNIFGELKVLCYYCVGGAIPF